MSTSAKAKKASNSVPPPPPPPTDDHGHLPPPPPLTIADEPISLTAKEVIFGGQFNLARQIVERDEDGNPKDLIGHVADGSTFGCVVVPPLVRPANDDERKQWRALHANDAWFKDIPEAQKDKAVPKWVAADGNGRWEAHVARYGMDAPLLCRRLLSSDPLDGMEAGMILGTSARPPHFLDQARFFYTQVSVRKLKKRVVKSRFNISTTRLDQLLKVWRNTDTDDRQKIIENEWSLSRTLKYIDKKLGGSDEASNKKKTALTPKARTHIKERINEYLAHRKCPAKPRAADEEMRRQHAVLYSIALVFEAMDGDYGDTPLTDLLQEHGILPNIDIQLEETEPLFDKAANDD